MVAGQTLPGSATSRRPETQQEAVPCEHVHQGGGAGPGRGGAWPGLSAPRSPRPQAGEGRRRQEKAELIQLGRESFVYSTKSDPTCWIPLRGHLRAETSSSPGLPPNSWTFPQHTNIPLKVFFL